MNYEIDQSWKIERTEKASYIAIANGNYSSLEVTARDKKIILEYLNLIYGKLQKNVLRLFAICVAILIKQALLSSENHVVVIDREYPGNDLLIKDLIYHSLKILQFQNQIELRFGLVGKSSSAHRVAHSAFRKRTVPDKSIKLRDIKKAIKK